MKFELLHVFLIGILLFGGNSKSVEAGPIGAGICYAGCAGIVVACFAAAGYTFGTVPGSLIATVPALVKCNAAFGVCEAGCMALLAIPIP